MQVYNDELYHYGKVGMKWGHRKNKLGITNKGNIGFVNKTDKKNIKKFVIKTSIFVSAIALSIYIKNNPKIVLKGIDIVSKILKKDKPKLNSDVFSKTLNRFLTVEEAMNKGFM